MTAGVAAAEVTFSGVAGIALVDDNGAYAAATHTTYSLAEAELRTEAALADARDAKDALVNPTAAQTTAAEKALEKAADKADGGPAAANAAARKAASEMRLASYYDLDVSATVETQTGATFAGWTLTVDQNGIDNLFDDTQQEDMKISGSVGGATIAFVTDLEANTNSYSLGYSVGDLTLGVTVKNNDDAFGNATGFSASYKMGDLSLSAAMSNESNDAEDDTSISFTHTMGALTVAYTTIQPGKDAKFGDEWDASIKYTAGAMSASFATDEASATTLIA
jgi:hypothetical protein